MSNRFFGTIEKDLKLVDAKINKFYGLKAGHAGEFAHINFGAIDKHLRPSLVLMSARLFNLKGGKAVSLATVIQLIHMASIVHLGISDQDSDHQNYEIDRRNGSQYPVLIGDYFYGRFFQHLCDAEILEMLKPLSEIICKINEGSIIRKEKGINLTSLQINLEVIQKETAELIAGSCKLGASLAGAKEVEQNILYHFGLALGMAYGIIERGFSFQEAEVYLDQSSKELTKLPESSTKKTLINFINKLSARKMLLKELMVV